MIADLLNVLYIPFDVLLGWTSYFPAVVAITIVGIISGIGVTLIQKLASRQSLLAQRKEDLRALKVRIRNARVAGDVETAQRLRGLSNRIMGKFVWGAIKPSFWIAPLITVVFFWTGDRLGYAPVRPGDTLEVRAHFEDGAAGYAHILPGETLKPQSALIASIERPKEAGDAGAKGPLARWKLNASKEGTGSLVIRHEKHAYTVDVPVSLRGGRPPDVVTVFAKSSPTQDQLQAVEFSLAPSLSPAWWNLWIQWMGPYLLVAMAVALGLRFLFRIH